MSETLTVHEDLAAFRQQTEIDQERIYGKNISFAGTWISLQHKDFAKALVKEYGKEVAHKLIDSF